MSEFPGITHEVDGVAVQLWPAGLPNISEFKDYRVLTNTNDTVRFPGTIGLPISLSFHDGFGAAHEIAIKGPHSGELRVLIPLPLEITKHLLKEHRCLIWQGMDLKERTLVDPKSTIAVCTFSYTGRAAVESASEVAARIANTHGIRIHVQTYYDMRAVRFEHMSSYWVDVHEAAGLHGFAISHCLDSFGRPLANSIDEVLPLASRSVTPEHSGNRAHAVRGPVVNNVKVHAALLLTQFCWGSAAVVNKLGLSGVGMNPLFFALIRESCAAPLLLLILACARGNICPWLGWSPASPLVGADDETIFTPCGSLARLVTPVSPIGASSTSWTRFAEHAWRGRAKRLVLRFLPGVFIFIDQFCSLTGVKLSSATEAAAWQPTQVIFTVLISACIGTEALTWRKVTGVMLTLSGAACLVVLGGNREPAPGENPRLGQLLFLGNSLASSLEVILWRHLLRNSRSPLGHLAVMAESYLMAATLMTLACILTSRSPAMVNLICPECNGNPWYLPPEALWAVGYSVIFQTIVGYCSQAWALRFAESSLVTLYATMQPVMATSISCALLAMGVNPRGALVWPGREMSGAVLIVLGLLVTIPGGLHLCSTAEMLRVFPHVSRRLRFEEGKQSLLMSQRV